MSQDIGIRIAETIQASHINRHPDPAHDLNPSTAASKKSPVRLRSHQRRRSSASHHPATDGTTTSDSSEIPLDILSPQPRQTNLPPLPDLRFEQSYLARIEPYASKSQYGWVAFYTFWDHLVMPLTQGMIWRLAVFGWRKWNTSTSFHGQGAGAKVRRWWWGVNNWKMPDQRGAAAQQGLGYDGLKR